MELHISRYLTSPSKRREYPAACCPLPTHKTGDTGKNFSINLAGDYWRCFSDSCNENNGGKRGGDCINFVALMDGISQLEAAQARRFLFVHQPQRDERYSAPSDSPSAWLETVYGTCNKEQVIWAKSQKEANDLPAGANIYKYIKSALTQSKGENTN